MEKNGFCLVICVMSRSNDIVMFLFFYILERLVPKIPCDCLDGFAALLRAFDVDISPVEGNLPFKADLSDVVRFLS